MTQTLTYIAITSASGALKIRQIVTTAERRAFSDEAGKKNGYTLTEDGSHWVRDLDNDAEVVAEMERSGDDYSGGWRRIDPNEIPGDDLRVFRSAWRDTGEKLDVDMPKARDIARGYIRSVRSDRLPSLDNAMKPLETKAVLGTLTDDDKLTLTGLEAQRQVLRDAPSNPAIRDAKTIDDLKAILASF